jgi:hypothetical protein
MEWWNAWGDKVLPTPALPGKKFSETAWRECGALLGFIDKFLGEF